MHRRYVWGRFDARAMCSSLLRAYQRRAGGATKLYAKRSYQYPHTFFEFWIGITVSERDGGVMVRVIACIRRTHPRIRCTTCMFSLWVGG